MGFCNCINKMFLVALNVAVFLVGVIVVAVASVVIHKSGDFKVLLDDGMVTVPFILLIVAICITLLGFFGCCGAMQENSCMLYTYATVVLIFFIAELALAVFILKYSMNYEEEEVKKQMKEALHKYDDPEDPEDFKKFVDDFQKDLECCGIDGPTDWKFRDTDGTGGIPSSCCTGNTTICPLPNAYQTGCFIIIKVSFDLALLCLGIAALLLAIIQVAAITIAFTLANQGNYNPGKVYRRSLSI